MTEQASDPTYTLFWGTGERQVICGGRDIAEALNNAGIGRGALRALDFYIEGDCHDYEWNTATRKWKLMTSGGAELK